MHYLLINNHVVIRTNGETAIDLNASKDTVKLYGLVGDVTMTHIANSSLHVFGTVSYIDLKDGHMVVEDGGYVSVAYKETATATAETEGTGKIGHAHASEESTAANDDANTSTAYNVIFDYDGVDKTSEGGKNHSDKSDSNPTTVDELKSEYQTDTIVNEKFDSYVANLSEDYVARIYTTGYMSLQAAASAAASGDTIYLLKDISYDGPSYGGKEGFVGKGVIVNLNNYTISNISSITDFKGSGLIFDGTSNPSILTDGIIENGTAMSKESTAIYAADTYTLTINNCTAITSTTKNSPHTAAVRATEFSNVTINGGTYTGYHAVNLESSGATVTINDGIFNGDLYFENVTENNDYLYINGGTFNGALNFGGSNMNYIHISIAGGTFNVTSGQAEVIKQYVKSGSTIVINGESYTK